MTGKIPERWRMTTLANVADLKGGIAKGKKRAKGELVRRVPFLRVANVQAGFLKLDEIHTIEATEGEIAKILLKPGDVLFNEGGDRDKLGRGWVWEGQLPECVHQNHVFRARPKKDLIDPYFLSYWGNSQAAKEYFEEEGKQTVNLASISLSKLGGLPIPLPSLSEQRRIVVRLEALLAKVDTSRQRLDRIPIILKRFRQAVMAAACEGRLTEDWRESQKQNVEWRRAQLGSVAREFTYGSAAKSNKVGRVPVLRMGNIQDGCLDWKNLVFTSDPKEIAKYKLEAGDVLFNRTNSPELVGKSAVFRGEQTAIYAGYLIRIRCSGQLLPDYLNYCLGSPMGREYCWQVKSDGVSQSNINAKKLAAFELPLPSVEEQAEIVKRVTQLFNLADQLEVRYAKANAQVDRLTQSILAKAFRGDLVPQDPNDEPAETLLAKLRTPPTEAPSAKRRGRPKKAGG